MDPATPYFPENKEKSRRARSQEMLEISWRLVRSDKKLMLFPLVNAVAAIGFGALMIYLVDPVENGKSWMLVAVIAASLPLTLIAISSGVGTASLVADLLDGREPSLRRALSLIRQRAGVILLWTLFAWTIGSILKVLEEKLPFAGRIIAYVVDVGFTFATLFAVPILAFEGLTPIAAVKRSSSMAKSRFGDLLIGSIAIGCASVVLMIPAFVLFIVSIGMFDHPRKALLATGLAVGWVLAVTAFTSSLDFAYRTVLYRNSIGQDIDRAGFSDEDLALGLHGKSWHE